MGDGGDTTTVDLSTAPPVGCTGGGPSASIFAPQTPQNFPKTWDPHFAQLATAKSSHETWLDRERRRAGCT
jgi:hypothetical protein